MQMGPQMSALRLESDHLRSVIGCRRDRRLWELIFVRSVDPFEEVAAQALEECVLLGQERSGDKRRVSSA
jgi:hypothetical protein